MRKRQHRNYSRTSSKKKFTFSKLTLHKLDWLEWVSLVLMIWFWIYPQPYTILFTVLLIIPVAGLLLNGIGKPSMASLVQITRKDDNDNYDVADFIDLPAFAIVLRVLKDFEFESFYSMIIPGTIAAVLVLVVLFLTHKRIDQVSGSKTWVYTSLIFCICLYSYAGTYGANCVYDYSEPVVYEARVTGKHISRGRRHTSYYIRVTPWGRHREEEDIKVGMKQYEQTQVGETARIDLKKGLFNIPWYYMESK